MLYQAIQYYSMPSAILIISFFLIFLRAVSLHGSLSRECFIQALVVWSAFAVLAVEIFSFLNLLSFWPVAIFWCGVSVCFFVFFQKNSFNVIFSDLKKYSRMPLTEKMLLTGACVYLALTALTAIVAAPNTWDSMTYHLSRVMHWADNGSVRHYPTNILRQLWASSGAEYIIMHLYLLTGNDRLFNLVQWVSFLGCAFCVSLISSLFNINLLGQIASVLLAVTIPMGILQASSTQNDLTVSFFMLAFVYYLLKIRKAYCFKHVFMAGLSLSIAVFVKPTAYIFMASFIIWFFIILIRQYPKRMIMSIAIMAVIFIAVNGMYFYRNFMLGGHILSPTEENRVLQVEKISIAGLYSNGLKNTALHLSTGFDGLNRFFEQAVIKLHEVMNINISDPAYSLTDNFVIERVVDEDFAGNFRHFLLIVTALIIFLVCPEKLKGNQGVAVYTACCAAGFLLFCLLLKWQIFGSRLQLVLFYLIIPVVVYALSAVFGRRAVIFILFFMLAASLPWLFKNQTRRLISSEKETIFNTERQKQYFLKKKDLFDDYKNAVSYIQQSPCRQVGLSVGPDDWEYPLWVFLEFPKNSYRIEHVGVKNKSNKYQDKGFSPCIIFKLNSEPLNAGYDRFTAARKYGIIEIYETEKK